MKQTLIQIHNDPVAISKKTVAQATEFSRSEFSSEATVIDFEAVLKRVMGDEDFLWELFHELIEELPHLEKALFIAIDKKDTATIVSQTRRLKSAAGNLGAMQLSDAAFNLEQIGRKGNLNQADKALNCLLIEANRLILHVGQLISFPMSTVSVS